MNKPRIFSNIFLLSAIFIFSGLVGNAATKSDTVSFKISMDKPHTHYFQIEMECSGYSSDDFCFKMPAWTPGYYWMLNFAKNVCNFAAFDSAGNELDFEKTDLDTWKVNGIEEGKVKVSYDVFAYQRSVAESFLDDGRAFISPTGVFLFREEKLNQPVVVKIEPYSEWQTISTGLEKIQENDNTFFAKNFNVLYDCPILAGNMEVLKFEAGGIPYAISMENPAEFDRHKYVSDFKRIVESTTNLIGDVPYKHYEFLIMDQGMGGLEHSNSMAVFSNSNYDITNSDGYKGWLSFIAHEFFHLYNVKTIRPEALGPFDYCKPNLTNMLWVAEGLTVYYEKLVLNRAGLMTRQEVLDAYSNTIANFENANGRKHLTAREAGFDTWLNFFSWNNHTNQTTISYYDIGCALGLLLDLKIRYESNNQKSLDDVMRRLYFDFHKKQNRGYTDNEFKQVCEEIATCKLNEIFNYANSYEVMDYQKYLSYAGIKLNLEPVQTLSFGLEFRKQGENWFVSNIDRNSPAWEIGLSIDDRIVEIDGKAANQELISALNDPDVKRELSLKIERRTGEKVFIITTFTKEWCNYKMKVNEGITANQERILKSWILE